jgi:hypothetical protein
VINEGPFAFAANEAAAVIWLDRRLGLARFTSREFHKYTKVLSVVWP